MPCSASHATGTGQQQPTLACPARVGGRHTQLGRRPRPPDPVSKQQDLLTAAGLEPLVLPMLADHASRRPAENPEPALIWPKNAVSGTTGNACFYVPTCGPLSRTWADRIGVRRESVAPGTAGFNPSSRLPHIQRTSVTRELHSTTAYCFQGRLWQERGATHRFVGDGDGAANSTVRSMHSPRDIPATAVMAGDHTAAALPPWEPGTVFGAPTSDPS